MKFIPALFSTVMVQALLAKRKHMTRRANGLDFINESPGEWQPEPWDNGTEEWNLSVTGKKHVDFAFFKGSSDEVFYAKCPYGQPGDVLWVRETWQQCGKYFHYKASDPQSSEIWRPSIFMPKTACRTFLEITSIKVERLQDISAADAKNEGIESIHFDEMMLGWTDYKDENNLLKKATDSFKSLWQNINGEKSWDINPYVWAITFKKIDRPANFLK